MNHWISELVVARLIFTSKKSQSHQLRRWIYSCIPSLNPLRSIYYKPIRFHFFWLIPMSKVFTLAELSEHTTNKDCWLLIGGKVIHSFCFTSKSLIFCVPDLDWILDFGFCFFYWFCRFKVWDCWRKWIQGFVNVWLDLDLILLLFHRVWFDSLILIPSLSVSCWLLP